MKKIIISIIVVIVILIGGFFLFNSYIYNQKQGDGGDFEKTSNLGACYIGGCSSQICSDQKDVVSTCEYQEEYACYKTAKCERQSNGKCGWTQTAELKACLDKAQ